MRLTISDKYQVVIPREARKKLGIKPGQQLIVEKVSKDSITYRRQPTMEELLDMGRGTLKDAPWDEEGIDPAIWIRRQRDAEDEYRNKLVGRE